MKVSIADEIFVGRESYLFSGGGMIIGVNSDRGDKIFLDNKAYDVTGKEDKEWVIVFRSQ